MMEQHPRTMKSVFATKKWRNFGARGGTYPKPGGTGAACSGHALGASSLLAHFRRHGGDCLFSHRHVLRHGSQAFLPELEGILARGYIIENELPLVVCDRIEGMLGDHHPGPHPGVQVA